MDVAKDESWLAVRSVGRKKWVSARPGLGGWRQRPGPSRVGCGSEPNPEDESPTFLGAASLAGRCVSSPADPMPGLQKGARGTLQGEAVRGAGGVPPMWCLWHRAWGCGHSGQWRVSTDLHGCSAK